MNNDSIIVYASCGEGHRIAAIALSNELNLPNVDILDFSHPLIKKFYSLGYRFTVQYFPFIWKLIFLAAQNRAAITTINKLNYFLFSRFCRFLLEKKPDFVIVTHFFPIYIVKVLKKALDIKLIVVVTDIGVHPLWVDECVDYYFVAMERTKAELESLGIEGDRITAGGIPLRGGFKKKRDILRIKEKIGLDSKETILLFCGASGRMFIERTLKKFRGRFNFIVIYGNDKRLKMFLDKNKDPSVKYFSHYSRIWELMEISSFIVTKPGGLTVFECLYKRKPMIFTHFIWGQEKTNMDAAVKLGAGLYAPYYRDLTEAIDTLRHNNAFSSVNFSDTTTLSVIKNIIRDNG